MDLKGAQVIGHGEDHIILKHPDGHEIKLMHKGTSHQHKETMHHYADGGKVVADKKPQPPQQPQINPQDAANIKNAFTHGYSDGGDVVKDPTQGVFPLPPNEIGRGAVKGADISSMTGNFDPVPPSVDQSYLETGLQNRTPLSKDAIPESQRSLEQRASAPTSNPTISAPMQQQQPIGDQFGTQKAADMSQKGLQMQVQGLQGEANAAGALGTQQAEQIHQHQLRQQVIDNHYNNELAAIDADRVHFQKDVQDHHIDPNQYMANKDTLGRVATGIGLILGGLGAGLAGGPNQALEMLNKQIDRDIDAQKSELGRKENLLSANLKQYGNMRDAMAMTRIQQQDLLTSELQQSAAKSQDPLVHARAQAAVGEILHKNAIEQGQLAGRQAIMKAQSTGHVDPTTAIRMLLPKEQQEKAIGDLRVAEKTFASHQAIDTIFEQIGKEQTAHNRINNPFQSSQKIAALRAQLVPLVMEASPSKRLTHESLAAEIDPLIPGYTTSPATRANMQEQLHHLMDTHADSPASLEGTGIQYPKYVPRKGFNRK